jgi:hypothetical protein
LRWVRVLCMRAIRGFLFFILWTHHVIEQRHPWFQSPRSLQRHH